MVPIRTNRTGFQCCLAVTIQLAWHGSYHEADLDQLSEIATNLGLISEDHTFETQIFSISLFQTSDKKHVQSYRSSELTFSIFIRFELEASASKLIDSLEDWELSSHFTFIEVPGMEVLEFDVVQTLMCFLIC